MQNFQTRYQTLAISKFNHNNINQITFFKNINFTINSSNPFKFIFKNIIWLLLLITGSKINFKKQKIKRKTSSKTSLTSFNIAIRKKNFFIVEKILNIILPNQENRLIKNINWSKNCILSFKKCLTYPELDIIIKNKMNMLIKHFNIILSFVFKNSKSSCDFFILRFLQFPIKK